MIKKNIIKLISKSEVISFDIFDTALLRNVSQPQYIFNIIDKIKGNNFYNQRVVAEEKAKTNLKKSSPTIKEIYKYVKDGNYKYEIEVERNFICKNSEIKEIYDYCVNNKKKIIFISDMYLSKDVLESFLKANGYNKIDKIYVSCDYNKTKNNGLFDVVLNDLKIKPNLLLHIGDSFKADFLSPKSLKIKSILYKRKKIRNNIIENDIVDSFLSNNTQSVNNKSIYYKYGFNYLGILLFSFSDWLKKDIINNNYKKIFFLSRDGFLMKRAFDSIYEDFNAKTHYLYVSRRSLNIPNLWKNPNFESLDKTISMSNFFTIKTFINRIGLNYDDYKNNIESFNISENEEFSLKTFKNDVRLKKFYNSIVSDVIKNSKSEHKQIIRYFKQEDFVGKIAIVDIGWHGSMQKNIEKICADISNNTNIMGYYFGQEKIIENGNGFLFNELDNPDFKYAIAGSFGFFESLFLAKHGTVLKYSNSNNLIEPVLDKYEFLDEDANTNIIEEIQDGAIDFCKTFSKNKIVMDLDFSSVSFHRIKRICVMPTLKEVNLLKNIMFNDTKNEQLIKNESLIYYIFNYKKFISDFYKSVWKMGFLKSTFKIPLPYYKIYKFLKKKEKSKN